MVIGDFNSILSQDDKCGGTLVTNREIRDFVDCITCLELVDTQHVGCFYTWTNNVVCTKLDRVLINSTWLNSAFDAFTEFLAPSCISDHSLSITNIF
ncbi:hypothetical protein F511_33874 [Dorcoceras hygrometricum]|uniref:Endonuclease/exonuclease/phosphatase domain-containing protein n=1 Tax=Dorcoceras hygrometricum TaxID=472368 RepID=A0A2Z7BYP8_9LAMI|nr:hypothetical protein F511_33874 [Dorcoceras hygrometricum]